ncbi:hypothetical protein J1N35_007221 [Gossypium stocksii]|uniref:Uncharacterized protein n=1 Tax=Gossypium stocksii TaxID=47602 RepID=A0A9D3W740_9ROSI|nr:hypothetical protein J1N35_007221 [Gossypium stocksii]
MRESVFRCAAPHGRKLAEYEGHKRENETVREASNSFRLSVHQFEGDVPEQQDVKILVKAIA